MTWLVLFHREAAECVGKSWKGLADGATRARGGWMTASMDHSGFNNNGLAATTHWVHT